MQLLVIGATGGTGLQIVEQSLQRGHYVTAFVRNPAKLTIQHPNLTVLTGDVLKLDTLIAAVRRQDAVLCALGGSLQDKEHVVVNGTKNLLAAMQQVGVQRLLAITSLGVGTSAADAPLLSKLVLKTLLCGAMAEKEKQEEIIRESHFDWSIVRPTSLTDGPLTGKLRIGEQLKFPLFSVPRISRADVAAFLLNQLDNTTYKHKAVIITGA